MEPIVDLPQPDKTPLIRRVIGATLAVAACLLKPFVAVFYLYFYSILHTMHFIFNVPMEDDEEDEWSDSESEEEEEVSEEDYGSNGVTRPAPDSEEDYGNNGVMGLQPGLLLEPDAVPQQEYCSNEEIGPDDKMEHQRDSVSECTEANECPIGQLPVELRWKIFQYLPEAMGNMKLVNRSWLTMINEWTIPENYPDFKSIDICKGREESIRVHIEINENEAVCYPILRELVEIHDPDPFHGIQSRKTNNFVLFEIPYGSSYLDRLCDAFPTKMKSVLLTRINGFSYDGIKFFSAVRHLLKSLKEIDWLHIDRGMIDEKSVPILLKISSFCLIRKVTCCIDNFEIHRSRDFLIDISERAQKIEARIDDDLDFVKAEEVDWIDTVLAMFNRGAKVIFINNYSMPIYNSKDLRTIAQHLSKKGDYFCFCCFLYEKPNQIIVKGVNIWVEMWGFYCWRVEMDNRQRPTESIHQ